MYTPETKEFCQSLDTLLKLKQEQPERLQQHPFKELLLDPGRAMGKSTWVVAKLVDPNVSSICIVSSYKAKKYLKDRVVDYCNNIMADFVSAGRFKLHMEPDFVKEIESKIFVIHSPTDIDKFRGRFANSVDLVLFDEIYGVKHVMVLQALIECRAISQDTVVVMLGSILDQLRYLESTVHECTNERNGLRAELESLRAAFLDTGSIHLENAVRGIARAEKLIAESKEIALSMENSDLVDMMELIQDNIHYAKPYVSAAIAAGEQIKREYYADQRQD